MNALAQRVPDQGRDQASNVRLLERPWPIHFIGDSHVLMFNDLLFDESRYYKRTFITKSNYCVGITASKFTQDGGLNHDVLRAFFNEGLLRFTDDRHLMASHLANSSLDRAVAVARGRARTAPFLVISAGDLDVREGILPQLSPDCDFVLLEDEGTDLSSIPSWEVHSIIPSELITGLVKKIVEPLFAALKWLRDMGFVSISLHSIAPPTTASSHRLPVGLRYKVVRLMNSLYRDFCAEHSIHFLDIWDQVTCGGLLDDTYFLDHVHLNKLGALRTMETFFEWMARDGWRTIYPVKEHYLGALDEARESLAERPGAIDPGTAEKFANDRVITVDFGREFAEDVLSRLTFDHAFANEHFRPDWSGTPPIAACDDMLLAYPDKALLDKIFEALSAPAADRVISSCMGCDWTVPVVRPFKSLVVEDAPVRYHIDGGPPGVLRGILYLNDVEEGGGPFEIVDDTGTATPVYASAGTMVIFDAERYQHRGTPPTKRPRHVLDIVFCPLPKGHVRRVQWSGNNCWPNDPYQYSSHGCITSYGPAPVLRGE